MSDTTVKKIDARVAYSVAKLLDLIPEWAYLSWWSPTLPAGWDDTQPLPVPPPFPAWLNIPGSTALHTALAIGASLYKRGLKGVKVLGWYIFKGRGDGKGTTISRVAIKLDIPGRIQNPLVLTDDRALIMTIPESGYDIDDGKIEPRLWDFNGGSLTPLDTGPHHYWWAQFRLGTDKALLIKVTIDKVFSLWYFADGKLTLCQAEGFDAKTYSSYLAKVGDGEAVIRTAYFEDNNYFGGMWYFDHGVLTKIASDVNAAVVVIGDRKALIWFAGDSTHRTNFRMIYLNSGRFSTILDSTIYHDFSAAQAEALGNNKALILEYRGTNNTSETLWYFDDGVLTRTPLDGYSSFLTWPIGDGEYLLEAYDYRGDYRYHLFHVTPRGATPLVEMGRYVEEESSYVLPLGIGKALVWWETTNDDTREVTAWLSYFHGGKLTPVDIRLGFSRAGYDFYRSFMIGDGQAIVVRVVSDLLELDLWYFDNGRYTLIPEIGRQLRYVYMFPLAGNGRAILRRYADEAVWLFDNGAMTKIDEKYTYSSSVHPAVSEKGFVLSAVRQKGLFYSEGEIDAEGKLIKRWIGEYSYWRSLGENKILTYLDKTVVDLKPVVIRH